MVVVVTRPASSGKRLFERLLQKGYRALWWPAFDIGAAPNPDSARAMLERLADYDLVVFVSAHAVHGALSLLNRPIQWPPGTLIGAVGAATRAAIATGLRPGAEVRVIVQHDDQPAGSEGFWHAWQQGAHRARRVLLIRAEEGRDWLGDRFAERGTRVDVVAVYSRRPHQPSAVELQQLTHWIGANEEPVTIFTSTEAVAALEKPLEPAARAWLRSGIAIACHERIVEQLSARGYARVINATFDDDTIIAKLESIGFET